MALLLKNMPRFAPLLRRNSSSTISIISFVSRAPMCMATDSLLPRPIKNDQNKVPTGNVAVGNITKQQPTRDDDPVYRRWKIREAEILRDIEPIIFLTKEILHSNRNCSRHFTRGRAVLPCDSLMRGLMIKSFRDLKVLHSWYPTREKAWRYMDGESLSAEDEKEVAEKLLAHHPHSEDKIGSGLASIMVDRHPQFKHSRCLFVIRTDGAWIDFSYQKCLRAYIRNKYPSYAERFIREHFKRGS